MYASGKHTTTESPYAAGELAYANETEAPSFQSLRWCLCVKSRTLFKKSRLIPSLYGIYSGRIENFIGRAI